MADDEQPSAEDLKKAGAVSQAAAEAVAGAGSEEEAREAGKKAVVKSAADVKLELSDEDASKIVDMLIERMSALGAFDPPPAPAAAAAAAPAPDAEGGAAEGPAAEAPAPPAKRSFAEKFAGT
jgi:hypothetical protein